MKIKKIIHQHRRDFSAELECEGCGHVQERRGMYDDDFYHRNIIPKIECQSCGKSGNEIGADYRPLQPKYPEGLQL